MKQLENNFVCDLIDVYSKYVELGLTDEVKNHAKLIESKYLQASTLISDDVFQLLGGLVDFYAPTGVKPLSINTAKKNIVFLRKRLVELEKNAKNE